MGSSNEGPLPLLFAKINVSFLFLSFILCSFIIGKSAASLSSPPNIVFILADDLGWDDVGFHGSEIKTPNIDKLAREGVILNNYYVQPMCTPTRSAIMTGKYPIHTGMQHHVIVGSQPYGLPLKEKLLPQHLKDIGYSTHALGKWHLGFFKEDYIPTKRGFDTHLGYYLGKEDYFDHTSYDGSYFGYDFHKNGSTLWGEDEVYSTGIFTSQAESIIQSHNKSKPLFLYLAHQAVHSGNAWDPIQVPQKYIDRFPYIKNYKRRLFAGVVSALDDSVGQVYKALQDSGMDQNTIIIFSTDNGGPTNGFDRNAACNWPLRGCKETLWQGGVRGVSFVHSPLLKKSGYVNNKLMHAVDWLPTIFSAINSTTMTTTTSPSTPTKKSPTSDADRNPERKSVDQKLVVSMTDIKMIDGINQWDSISSDVPTQRQEVLLNIDPIEKYEGVILGNFKLIKGDFHHGKFDGWYPPPSEVVSPDSYDARHETNLDYEGIFKEHMTSFHDNGESKSSPYNKRMTDMELRKLISEINEEYESFVRRSDRKKSSSSSDLKFDSENSLNGMLRSESQREVMQGKAIVINCGPKPKNASTNCNPKKEYCLYNLASDPCEFNNIAVPLSRMIPKMKGRLNYYRSSMIPPGNKPIDPSGNPQLHGGVWKPWL